MLHTFFLIASNQTKIASLGGLEAIINAMLTHKDISEVQDRGCGALFSLAYLSDGTRFKLYKG